ncbi:MAG TPA: hypothetical protein VLV18_07420 [Terriglobales bacterium]|nr:hypothetical protein [Terriglobales bacterium]
MRLAEKTVLLLLLLQIVSTLFLWSLQAVSAGSEGKFAVFLAVDLSSFAMISYVYTHEKWSLNVSRSWVLAGSLGLLILLLASLYFP